MEFADFRGEIKLKEPLAGHTSFRIGGPADVFAVPADKDDLIALLRSVKEQGLPFFVLGGGSNLLVKDGGVRGVVISLARVSEIAIEREYRALGGTYALIRAGAGAPLARLLAFCAEKGYTGLEFATGIPGTVGGALCMNAGTAEGEIGGIVESVEMVSPAGETVVKSREEMEFGYRRAAVPAGHLIVGARVVVRRGEREKIAGHVKDLMEKRREWQPWGQPSAGSVFKNPLDEAAGRLIETAGLKGRSVGGAQVSEKHANFIVNTGGAKAADVLALMDLVRNAVLDAHKIRLEPEIKIVGED